MGNKYQCSTTCGEGETTRQVACFKLDHHRGNDEECDVSSKPDMRRKCNRGSCPQVKDYEISVITSNNVEGTSHWRVGPWSDCSVTCGPGWKRRQVVCQDERGDSDKCEYKQRPPDTDRCDGSSCGTWNTGMWSECSVTCGGDGEQSRQVLCQMGDRTLADNLCNITLRPPHRRLCNSGPCSGRRRWYIGPWAPCSSTCGRGHQQREVMCVDEDNKPRPQNECEGKKPRNNRICKMGKCPRWKTGHWSKCSVTCGSGVRMRDVKCKARHHWSVDPAFCVNKKKPKAEEPCLRKPCSEFAWKKGEWSECSMTCGFGTKSRTVGCVDRMGHNVSEDHCSDTRKPKSRRRCSEFPCPYIWNTSPWTECNSSCGIGHQTRKAVCQAVTKEGWILPGEVPYGCRPEEKPAVTRTCNHGDCGSQYLWVVGPWGQH